MDETVSAPRNYTINQEFYSDETPCPWLEKKISEIHTWGNNMHILENTEHYFKWLFPTYDLMDSKGSVCPLSEDDADFIIDDRVAAERYVTSYMLFLKMIGARILDVYSGKLCIDINDRSRRSGHLACDKCQKKITRVLTSLRQLGFAEYSDNLLRHIEIVCAGMNPGTLKDNVSASLGYFWVPCVAYSRTASKVSVLLSDPDLREWMVSKWQATVEAPVQGNDACEAETHTSPGPKYSELPQNSQHTNYDPSLCKCGYNNPLPPQMKTYGPQSGRTFYHCKRCNHYKYDTRILSKPAVAADLINGNQDCDASDSMHIDNSHIARPAQPTASKAPAPPVSQSVVPLTTKVPDTNKGLMCYCGKAMSMGTTRSGPNAGKSFYRCSVVVNSLAPNIADRYACRAFIWKECADRINPTIWCDCQRPAWVAKSDQGHFYRICSRRGSTSGPKCKWTDDVDDPATRPLSLKDSYFV